MAIFDNMADHYDGWYKSHVGHFVDEVETRLAFELFKVKPGMHILDVGCGTGNFSIKLAKMGCKVTGVDISEEMLAQARKKSEAQGLEMTFHKMDIYELDFANETFDGVFSMAAFEFITKPQQALEALLRVSKKGAKVLVGTISKDGSWGKLYQRKALEGESIFKHADFKTLEDMKSWQSDKLVDAKACLFIEPTSEESAFTLENEQALAGTVKGSFICALWQK